MMLIDGRNRREACRLAGVVPQVRPFDGEDPSAFVLSVNVNRRHMTAGQRAAARALLTADVKQGSRTDLGEDNIAKFGDVPGSSLRQARFILRYDKPSLYSVLRDIRDLIAKEPDLGLHNFVHAPYKLQSTGE